MNCYYFESADGVLSCSQINEFDKNGTPKKACSLFPCAKYKSIILGLGSKEGENE